MGPLRRVVTGLGLAVNGAVCGPFCLLQDLCPLQGPLPLTETLTGRYGETFYGSLAGPLWGSP